MKLKKLGLVFAFALIVPIALFLVACSGGATERGAQWTAGEDFPTQNLLVGDLHVLPTGYVYKFDGQNWMRQFSIRGGDGNDGDDGKDGDVELDAYLQQVIDAVNFVELIRELDGITDGFGYLIGDIIVDALVVLEGLSPQQLSLVDRLVGGQAMQIISEAIANHFVSEIKAFWGLTSASYNVSFEDYFGGSTFHELRFDNVTASDVTAFETWLEEAGLVLNEDTEFYTNNIFVSMFYDDLGETLIIYVDVINHALLEVVQVLTEFMLKNADVDEYGWATWGVGYQIEIFNATQSEAATWAEELVSIVTALGFTQWFDFADEGFIVHMFINHDVVVGFLFDRGEFFVFTSADYEF